jgi:hypothetical protein
MGKAAQQGTKRQAFEAPRWRWNWQKAVFIVKVIFGIVHCGEEILDHDDRGEA